MSSISSKFLSFISRFKETMPRHCNVHVCTWDHHSNTLHLKGINLTLWLLRQRLALRLSIRMRLLGWERTLTTLTLHLLDQTSVASSRLQCLLWRVNILYIYIEQEREMPHICTHSNPLRTALVEIDHFLADLHGKSIILESHRVKNLPSLLDIKMSSTSWYFMTATVLRGLSESREGRSAFGANILIVLVCLSHWSWWESFFLNVIQRQRGWTHQQGGAKGKVAKIPCSNLNPYISILHCLSPFMQT